MSNRLDEQRPSESSLENEGEIRAAVERLVIARDNDPCFGFLQNVEHEWKSYVILAGDTGFEISVKEGVFRGFAFEGLTREQQVDRLTRYIYKSIELQLIQETGSIPSGGYVQ